MTATTAIRRLTGVEQKEIKKALKERMKTIEDKVKDTTDKEIKGQWKKVKEKLQDEFKAVSKLIADEMSTLRNKIEKVFKRVEHHILHKEVCFFVASSQ